MLLVVNVRNRDFLTWQVKAMAVISGIAGMVSGAFLNSQSCRLKEER